MPKRRACLQNLEDALFIGMANNKFTEYLGSTAASTPLTLKGCPFDFYATIPVSIIDHGRRTNLDKICPLVTALQFGADWGPIGASWSRVVLCSFTYFENWSRKLWESQCPGRAEELNRPFTRPDALNDWSPQMPDDTRTFEPVFRLNVEPRTHRRPVPIP